MCLAASARRCQSSEGGFGGDLGTYFCGARFGMNGFKDSFMAQPVRARVGKCFQIFVISLPVEGNVVCWWSRPLAQGCSEMLNSENVFVTGKLCS